MTSRCNFPIAYQKSSGTADDIAPRKAAAAAVDDEIGVRSKYETKKNISYLIIMAEEYSQGLKVIGVGLPRTGTWSTALALSRLLDCDISSIHHGMQLNQLSSDQIDFWIKAFDGGVTDEEWRVYFRSFRACLDLPAIVFYKDLIRVFPQAIVVFTQRDPDSWFKSWHSSIADSLRLIDSRIYRRFLDLDERVIYFNFY